MALKQSGKSSTSTSSLNKQRFEWWALWCRARLFAAARCTRDFFRQNWIGTIIMLAVTLAFFMPLLLRLGSYSPGGDAMFNAWIIERNQHCILRQDCPDYLDANIYYPNKDTMLYSENQLTPGILTLPIHFLSDNPLYAYNIYTVACFFFAGWFMYLLVKRLSKGNEFLAVLAGLIFAFAPFKMAAIFHMQNISIFFLPLAVLATLNFFESKRKRYLVALAIILSLQFYASWYQMVFVLAVFGLLLLGVGIFKLQQWKQIGWVGVSVFVAVLTTVPLLKEYMRFSSETGATFSMKEQLLYESSLVDYVMPHGGTLIGKLYYHLNPGAHMNAWNLDSYSYHGLVLYAIAVFLVVMAYLRRKKTPADKRNYRWVIIFAVVALVGFILSLGPLLKVFGSFTYGQLSTGERIVVPMPYILIDKFLPQLAFIRAVGRWSVLTLFGLCVMLAFLPYYLDKIKWAKQRKRFFYIAIGVLAFIELAPLGMIPMSTQAYSYNLSVPAVYKYVKAHPEIDKIVIIHGDSGYPGEPIPIARAEWVLWAGYHNREIFNGYSGYEPKNYLADYIDFKDLDPHDVIKMRGFGLKYVIIDKQLSATRPELIERARVLFPQKLYEDQRYALFKLPQ